MYLLDMQVSGFTSLRSTASPPRRGRIQELPLQPRRCASTPGKARTAGPSSSTELPRAPKRVTAQDVDTPGETTRLQAQFSLGTIKTRLKGTLIQPAHPLPHSRKSCPFYLNSHCKILSANQKIWPPALCMAGQCLAFSECPQINRLTINHKNLGLSVLMG